MRLFSETDLQLLSNIKSVLMLPRTILDIAEMPHYENVISNFYAYYLDPKADHGLGGIFLTTLCDLASKGDFIGGEGLQISREEATIDAKRIDLLVSDRVNGRHIIIENKIYHWLANDLGLYWEHVKVNADSKFGVVLTLKPMVIDEKYRSQFMNVTHIQWLEHVRIKAENIELNPRQRVFLDDFIQTLTNLTISETMNEQASFYFEHPDLVRRANDCKTSAIRHISNQLNKFAEEMGWLTKQVSDRYRHVWSPTCDEIYYTIQTEYLWNAEMRVDVMIELWNGAFQKRESLLKVVADKLKIGVELGKDSGATWAHLLKKSYSLQIDELADFAGFLKLNIDEDFQTNYDDLIDAYFVK
jgi:hypothetical protein